MKVTIRNRWIDEYAYEVEVPDDSSQPIRVAVETMTKDGANLYHADLRHTDLRDADLRYAHLYGADLSDADLHNADLSFAYFSGAYLRDAKNLHEAYILPDVKFGTFIHEIVPALLVAGGKPLAEVANVDTWKCHSWSNCPMHVAFDATGLEGVPAPWREHAKLFVRLFDAGAIPLSEVVPLGAVAP